MIILTNNFHVIPFVILTSLLNAWLWIIFARIVYSPIASVKVSTFADGFVHFLDNVRLRYFQRRVPEWARWVVAISALACGSELKRAGKTATLNGHVIPSEILLCREVLSHSIGVCVCNTSATGKPLVLSEIIPANTPVPCTRTGTFKLEKAQQNTCIVECLEGKSDAKREDCLMIGEVVIEDLPTEQTRTERIQVTFNIDKNGIIEIRGRDDVSGKEASVNIDYKQGISQAGKPASV